MFRSFRFVSLFRVLVNVINFHDIISSSWLLGKIRCNFDGSILSKMHSELENHNLICNTVVNSGGKCDTLCNSKNSYFHKFSI